ncbi:MAG: transposase, partial [Candidatus Latescibacteria bacterium]|nr:transposase [Candidatus Latescibacterota bacterium]
PDALDRLMAQDWPGNVRELKHAVQKLAVLVGGEVITALDVEAVVAGSNQHPPAQRVEPATWREARRQVERDLIVARLAAHGWRVDDTARALGLDRTYLYKKMKRLGIESGRRDSRLRGNDTIQQVASRTVPIQGGNATPNRTQRSNKTSPRRATHHKTRKRVRRPSPNILVSDDLWALIRPLVQPDPLSRTDGRPRLDDRAALTGILFVLKAGIAWESLPSTIGCGSGMTCWRRLREWQRAGVWGRIQRILLDRLDGAAQINWSRVSQDGGTATPSS